MIIVFLLLAAASLIAGLTASGSGFLNLSNITRYIFLFISVVCALIAVILILLKVKKNGGR